MAQIGRIVFFKKLIDGSVSVFMQDVDSTMTKWFTMDEKISSYRGSYELCSFYFY